MTILITLFVATQLTLGFCALILAMRQNLTGLRTGTDFHPEIKTPETALQILTPSLAQRSSGLYLSEQCGWR